MEKISYKSQYFPVESLKLELKDGFFVSCRSSWRQVNEVRDYSRFYFVLEGGCNLCVDGKRYTLHPGSMALIPAGKIVSASLTDEKRLIKYWCKFTATVGEVSIFDWLDIPYAIDVDNTEAVRSIFHSMLYDEYGNKIFEPSQENAHLYTVFDIFMEKILPGQVISDELNFMQLISYIELHMHEKITVEKLSEAAYMSESTFYRAFRKKTGVSPIAFVNAVRLEKAKRLLVNSDMHIREIAEQVGFENGSFFWNSFHKHTGVTPAVYRQQKGRLERG